MKTFLLAALVLTSPFAATAAQLASGEWFIDGDSGRGAGTPFPVPAAVSGSPTVSISPAVLNALAPGYHLLGVRVQDDAGEWGHVVWRAFHKLEEPPQPRRLAAGAWFVDGDPGVGNGTSFSAPDAATASLSPQISAATLSGLSEGYHLLGVRLRDDLNRWGPIVWRAFHIDRLLNAAPPIVSVEYRVVQSGMGVASGSSPASPPGQQVELALSHGNDSLTLNQDYLLQVFSVDALGRRGHAAYAPFAYRSYSQVWLEQNFTPAERADPMISGDGEDPDKDGLTNLEERMFALNAKNPGDAALAAPGIEAGATVALQFRVPGGGTVGADGIYRTSNLQFAPWSSSDLGDWTMVPAASITAWSLTDVGEGAARLRLDLLAAQFPDRRFFVIEGVAAPAIP